jgi:hypothetical protein
VFIKEIVCDREGHFRAELSPGRYVLDRTDSDHQLKSGKGSETIEVRPGRWTRLDGLTDTQCPDSGIYGWDYRPCSGAKLSGSYTCVSARDPEMGQTVATASCEKEFPTFSMPLAPGRYRVQLTHWPEQTVDIGPGRWVRLGVTEAAPCPPVP